MSTKFPPFAGFHDPDGDGYSQFRLTLAAGRTVTAFQVDVVDSLSATIDSATDLVISGVTCGQLSTNPNVWVVTFRRRGGSAGSGNKPKEYFIRCRYTDNGTPTPTTDDRTASLLVKQN